MAHDHSATGNLKTVFFLNLSFTIVEVVGGLLTNSVAILSDAVHDLGDTITLALSWAFEQHSTKGRTDSQTFGYKRYSLLGAFISAVVLILGSVFVLMKSIPRLFHPEEVEAGGMLAISIVGIGVNLAAVLRLKRGKKLNERVAYLHLLEDVLGWMAVFVISIILLFRDIPILDPICSIAITVFVLSKIFPNLKAALRIFLQYAPSDFDVEQIRKDLKEEEHVIDVHDIHLWSLDGVYHVFSAHVAVDGNPDLMVLEVIKEGMGRRLKKVGIEHITLEFEPSDKACVDCDL